MTTLQAGIETVAGSDHYEFLKTLYKLGWRLFLDFITVLVLLRFIYYPKYKHNDLFFTFFIFNLIIFFICFLLNRIEMSLGAAFGLFAVFSMLRYRTEDLSIKDMTYLFLVIAIGLISAVTKLKNTPDVYEFLFIAATNTMLLLVTYIFEKNVFFKREGVMMVNYEKLDLILPGKDQELLQDLKQRLGISVKRVKTGKIDFVKSQVQLKVYFDEV
ncbi:MAG: DUF4956 domain-containing protein [Bacteroidia bacterium]|jgi:hypothetical protein|nr:DUF4956 domain-containing protein [Bacteroidia bacterium]